MARDKITNHREAVNIVTCPVMRSLLVLGGKWKLLLLYLLAFESKGGHLRYSDFVDLIPNISAKVLSSELKELEADGPIIRITRSRPEWNTPCRKPAQSWLPR